MKKTDNWNDWVWQQKNAITNIKALKKYFPNLSDEVINDISFSNKYLKFRITPYLLSLIKTDDKGNPLTNDPIWLQTIPSKKLFEGSSSNKISEFDENWELPEEMVNPMLHHKYYNRVVLRIQNNCLSYCMYCFESKRTLDITPNIPSYNNILFKQSIEYIKSKKEIEEVILSGGEPFLMNNKNLNEILSEIRKIKHIKAIRVHTRVFTHNPFRIDDGLLELFDKYDITSLNVHFSHPNEITDEMKNALHKFDKSKTRTIMLAHIPLLKEINDDDKILVNLFMQLYELKIIPYYLLHAMPNTLGSEVFRTSVKKGVELIRKIKRYYSNPAIPEYIIVHKTSKHNVPMELDGTSEFEYHKDYVRFKNYKGKWCIYKEN